MRFLKCVSQVLLKYIKNKFLARLMQGMLFMVALRLEIFQHFYGIFVVKVYSFCIVSIIACIAEMNKDFLPRLVCIVTKDKF